MPEHRTARVELTLTFTLGFELDSDDPFIAEDYPAGMSAEDAVEELMGWPEASCGYDLGWLPDDTMGEVEAEWLDQEDDEDA